jgi:hypothetical protein
MLRFAKGGWKKDGLWNWSDGAPGSTAVDDLKRSLSLIFGDGKGSYPPGAYLDMIMVHAIESQADIDAAFEGYDRPDPKAENIGVLAMLMDYRDGTNLTGLNPKEEKLIRHIGFSGHASPAAMMEMIHRDTRGILDGMLVAINANDRLHFNMQYNAIPVAAANNMGIIAMKVFADGAMYTKPATFTSKADMVVLKVGSETLPSKRLVEYALTTPGIHTAIIGTGQIDANAANCQLQSNLIAAQIKPGAFGESDRRDIEKLARFAKEGKTNYFQKPAQPLGAPRSPAIAQEMRDSKRTVQVKWQTAYAGDEPITHYEIWRDNKKIGQLAHKPQINRSPFSYQEVLKDKQEHRYQIVTVDAIGRTAKSEDLSLT